MIKNITNLGDAALYCDFGNEVSKKINKNVIDYFKNLQKIKIKGVTNIAPSYNKLIITFDLSEIKYESLKEKILNLKVENLSDEKSEKINIPVCCDEEFNLDLNRLYENLDISIENILKKFFDVDYYCYMTGFVAGMPFLGDTLPEIRLRRLETPRVKVPKGSVGLTEQFCNIYTFESPGGWNIIGNTPAMVFDKKKKDDPSLIKPGDTVKFFKITKKEYLDWNEQSLL